jgi:hypothetical protein
MKSVLGALLLISLIGNGYLLLRLMKADDQIEAGVHGEMMSTFGLQDLSYFLRNSGATKEQLLELARKQPVRKGHERAPPQITANRFVWFPLDVSFTKSGTIDQIKVAGDSY